MQCWPSLLVGESQVSSRVERVAVVSRSRRLRQRSVLFLVTTGCHDVLGRLRQPAANWDFHPLKRRAGRTTSGLLTLATSHLLCLSAIVESAARRRLLREGSQFQRARFAGSYHEGQVLAAAPFFGACHLSTTVAPVTHDLLRNFHNCFVTFPLSLAVCLGRCRCCAFARGPSAGNHAPNSVYPKRSVGSDNRPDLGFR